MIRRKRQAGIPPYMAIKDSPMATCFHGVWGLLAADAALVAPAHCHRRL